MYVCIYLEKELKICYDKIVNYGDESDSNIISSSLSASLTTKKETSIVSETTSTSLLSISYLNLLRKIESNQLLINHKINNNITSTTTTSNNNDDNNNNQQLHINNDNHNIDEQIDTSNNMILEKYKVDIIKFEYMGLKILGNNYVFKDALYIALIFLNTLTRFFVTYFIY